MSVYDLKELEAMGFERMDDGDAESYHQYVLDKKDYFNSDYLYSDKVNIGTYRVIRYNDGANEVLQNWQLILLMDGGDYLKK